MTSCAMQVCESSQPITRCKARQPRAGDDVVKLMASCHVDTMSAISWNNVGKNVEITSKWGPSVHNRINNLSMQVCSTSLMVSLIRSVGGLSKYFYQGLWLADIRLCTSNSVFLRVVVTNSPQLIKVRDLNGCHGNQTTFWTLPYMVATESPTIIAFE